MGLDHGGMSLSLRSDMEWKQAPSWIMCRGLYRVTVTSNVGNYGLPCGPRDRLAFGPWHAESARSSSTPVPAVPEQAANADDLVDT